METADLLWEQGSPGWEWAVADGNTGNYSSEAGLVQMRGIPGSTGSCFR